MSEETSVEACPWDKLPKETARAFAAFDRYRAAGPTRSLAETYRQETGKNQAAQPSGEWTGWYARFDWKARATAYDIHLTHLTRQTAENRHIKRIGKYRKRSAKIGRNAAEIANAFLLKGTERLQKLDPEEIDVKSLPAFLRASVQIAQLGLNMEAEALGVRELEGLLDDADKEPAEDTE